MPGLSLASQLPKRLCKWMFGLALCAALGASACQRPKSIVVASKQGPEQMLLGEIVAQHLETRLTGVKVNRRLGAGNTPILYQALAGGDFTVYPETTGVIATSILKQSKLNCAATRGEAG